MDLGKLFGRIRIKITENSGVCGGHPRFATVQKITLKLIGGPGGDRDTRPLGAIFLMQFWGVSWPKYTPTIGVGVVHLGNRGSTTRSVTVEIPFNTIRVLHKGIFLDFAACDHPHWDFFPVGEKWGGGGFRNYVLKSEYLSQYWKDKFLPLNKFG